MSEMTEIVAKAICNSDAAQRGLAGQADPQNEQYFRELARAAIEAMRDATEKMARRGVHAALHNACDTVCAEFASDTVKRTWHAMIDAALTSPTIE